MGEAHSTKKKNAAGVSDPGVDLASNRNEYQEYLLKAKTSCGPKRLSRPVMS